MAGVILPPPVCESHVILAELKEAAIPTVAVATGRFRADASCVCIDDFKAAYEMARHLLSLGHRRIGFIKGHPNQTASGERWRGRLRRYGDRHHGMAGAHRDPTADRGHGRSGARLLIREIRRRRDGLPGAAVDHLVPHELIVRESAAAPPEGPGGPR